MLALAGRFAAAQNVPQLQALKDYAQEHVPPGYDSAASNIYLIRQNHLNYLFPLYQLFHNEQKFRQLFHSRNYYDELSGYISFTEDYQSSLQYAIRGYDTISLVTAKGIGKAVDNMRGIAHADAVRTISYLAQNSRVIMINEAHNKPLHRVFVMSLLPELYRKGFRYLALEMLNSRLSDPNAAVTSQLGYYSCEPVAAEMIRIAKELGFKLIAYEDTLAYRHSPRQRDSAQAQGIYSVLKRDTDAKILVLGSYGHIAEHSTVEGYIPMAMAFKTISGIDPLTIDQTDMTEESNMEYGRELYRTYIQKFPINMASIAMAGNEPLNITNNPDYDLAIIHPPTQYRDGRPTWLAFNGVRKATYVKPAIRHTFLVQAFYERESKDLDPDTLVPADQTYIPTNGQNYLLYLRKGRYVIVFRDINYEALGRLSIQVD